MKKTDRKSSGETIMMSTIITVLLGCIAMGIVDAVIQPGYLIKSLIKIFFFVGIPLSQTFIYEEKYYQTLFKANRKCIKLAVCLGVGIYVLILLSYFAFKNVFDFSSITDSLNSGVGVTKNNFIWVAIYISFINSFIEEFFFRGYSFLHLKDNSNRKFAYLFSAFSFAVYHISMMIGWFAWPVMVMTIAGLAAGGAIFNFLDEKYENIYLSWIVHMFANFSINTIGFILFDKVG